MLDVMSTFEDLQQSSLTELTRQECLRHLRSTRVGRIVFVDQDGPAALPVNYRMDGETILFRVSPTSDLCLRLDRARVAFEVDRLDEFHLTGWSVLLRGTASYAEADDLPEHRADRPLPWARGPRHTYVRVTPDRITGRELIDEEGSVRT